MTRAILLVLLLGCNGAHRDQPDAGVDTDAAVAPVVKPSNVGDFGMLEANGVVAEPPGDGNFNTDENCAMGSVLGNCTVAHRSGLPDACVCRADSITIDHHLRIFGSRALVLFAAQDVTISGLLDLSGGFDAQQGPGAATSYPTGGGYWGGSGGSFGGSGGLGGPDQGTTNPYSSAPVWGEPTLVPLLGGMAGQNAGFYAGGGGGALQITAGERITITGEINAGGGGGAAGKSGQGAIAGGAGGGSGGGILLEAWRVSISGAAVANGGGGGGGGGASGSGSYGIPGGNQGVAIAALGGGSFNQVCYPGLDLSGGHGGYGMTGTTPAQDGAAGAYRNSCSSGIQDEAWIGGGGGGGGVGRIRINRIETCDCEGTILPAPTFGTLETH